VAYQPPEPIRLPERAWTDPEVQRLCSETDAIGLIRHVIARYPVTQGRIAYWMGIDAGAMSRLLNSTGRVIRLDRWRQLADALDMPAANRLMIMGMDGAERWVARVRDEATTRPTLPTEEHDLNRRELLTASGAAATGAVLDLIVNEPGRMQDALDTGSASAARVAQLHRGAESLGRRVIRVPPAAVLPEAASRFRLIRRLVAGKQTLAIHRELARVGALLATVMGEALFNQGQFQLAQDWYAAAARAATEAGDTYLADIATAGAAYIPTYSADPHGVLELIDPRLERSPAPSPAIAWLWAFKAKAHAALKDHASFQRAIDRARDALERSRRDSLQAGIFSFLPEKLHFYEARGWVELGNATAAAEASERALPLYDPSENTEPALVRFERASALAQAAEVEEACRVATATVNDPRTYRSITVVTRAREFDRLLTPAGRNGAVIAWREVLRDLRPPPVAVATGAPES
jgi:tetratricopeptide (TPR) repeat protein